MQTRLTVIALTAFAAVIGAFLFTSAGAGGQQDAGHLTCDPSGISGPAFFDTNVPYPIPDFGDPDIGEPGVVSACFTIDDPRIINQVNVGLGITHTYVGDLIVTLTHEDTGTSVTLIDRPDSGDCSGDDISIVLTDPAAASVEDKCNTPGPTAISGTWRPVEPLAAFIGEGIGGTWTLSVSDNFGIDTGALESWTVILALSKDPTATPTSTVTATATETPTSTVTATATATATSTATATATPTSTGTATATATPTLAKPCGDANSDGSVDSIDALVILQKVAGFLEDVPNPDAADVNNDGAADSLDSLLVLQKVAGLLQELAC